MEHISLAKDVNSQTALSRLVQDYLYSLTGDDDMELCIIKDETPNTRYLPMDPDNEEQKKAA